MFRIAFTISLFIAATAAAAGSDLGSCGTVKRQIRDEGAGHVLELMWVNDEELFLQMLPHIAAAEPCWLEVANLLKAVSDAGASEELESAMSRAVMTNPERALTYLSRDGWFPISLVCSGSQVGVDENEAGFRRWLEHTRVALENAKLPRRLEEKRQQCLAEILKEERRSR